MRYAACQTFAGGFDVGAVTAGWELARKVEDVGGFGMAPCDRNRDVLGHGWEAQASAPSEWVTERVDAVFANPPCSGFSVLSASSFRGINSRINTCMWNTFRYAARCRAPVVVMESVRPAFTSGRPLMQQLRALIEEETGDAYGLYHVMHDNHALGGVASRKRYFMVASRAPFGVRWPVLPHSERPVLRDAIGDLEGLEVTWEPQQLNGGTSSWVTHRDDRTVDGHWVHETPNVQRCMRLLEHTTWEAGEFMGRVLQKVYDKLGYLPPPNDRIEAKLLQRGPDGLGFNQLVRWHYDRPARVVTGGVQDLSLHPTLPRCLTHREAARVMGFPDAWRIEPLRDVSGLRMMWGKGIPVHSGRWIATWAARSLNGAPGEQHGVSIGEREWLIAADPIRVKEEVNDVEAGAASSSAA